MDPTFAATVLASMESTGVSPHVLGRLNLAILVLAGILIITACWDWLKRR